MKSKSETWYWNESVNRSCSNIEDKGYSDVEKDNKIKIKGPETQIEESKT